MERTLKENNLKYFKSEKFSKGVFVKIKSKIEELYLIEKGRVALVVSAPKNEERLRSALEWAQAPKAKEKKQNEKTAQKRKAKDENADIKGKQKE